MKYLTFIFEKKREKVDKLQDCSNFKEFEKKIKELKSVVKELKKELKNTKVSELDDYIEKKLFGRDV